MPKTIVLLGAGSTYFTKGICESLVRKGGEWRLRLVDIDPQCVDIATLLCQRLVAKYEAPITVTGTVERKEALPGADAVVSTIGVGGRKAWEKDVLAFRRFGIYQSTGDTFGAGGVSRALRTVPVLVDVAADMARLCPDALLVNFTNPMTVNCWALHKASKIKTVGLCYGVTWYQHRLAKLIEVPFSETWTKAIGVNHFTWITDFLYQGQDAWPLVREKIGKRSSIAGPYTWELFDTFGAFPCVGDGHICEFIPGFQGKGAYYGKTFGIDGGHNFEEYARHWDRVFEEMADQAYGRKPIEGIDTSAPGETFRDEDLFIDVLCAAMGEAPVERTVNLPNMGQAANLPLGAVLEGTTLVNGAGFHPLAYGELPPGLTAILQRILAAQALTVEAALRADRNLVVQALMADLTAVKRADAEKLTDCILRLRCKRTFGSLND
jgi:alpha-galactosidase